MHRAAAEQRFSGSVVVMDRDFPELVAGPADRLGHLVIARDRQGGADLFEQRFEGVGFSQLLDVPLVLRSQLGRHTSWDLRAGRVGDVESAVVERGPVQHLSVDQIDLADRYRPRCVRRRRRCDDVEAEVVEQPCGIPA